MIMLYDSSKIKRISKTMYFLQVATFRLKIVSCNNCVEHNILLYMNFIYTHFTFYIL